ncbi:extracellular solute-binding protein [Halobium palmae]|uniref:Extracellular solute-binding protein n=1 Tax=Halobium palmae TaxID=1776492 RepID=A0ABD5RZB3_9EURY
MTMERRSVLKKLGVAGAVGGLAGCMSVQQQDGGSTTAGGDGGDGGSENESSGEGNASTASTSSGPAGTAQIWYSLPDPEIPARKEAMSRFNESSQHAVEGSDISDMRKKTTSAIPAGQGPQTFEWAHDWTGDYSQRGFLVDQSDQVSVSLDQFTEAAANACRFEGSLYGLPHTAETVGLVYNTDIVDEAPESVADMKSVMEEHHDPGNNKYGLAFPFTEGYFISAWMQAFGGYIFDNSKEAKLGIDKPEAIEGAQFAVDNFAPYMPNDPAYEPQASAFASGNTAFAFNGPWYLATLNDKGVNYEVTKLPTPEGGEPTPYTGITIWYFAKAMEEGGADAAAARKFIEWYVTNEEMARTRAEEQGSIPVLTSIIDEGDLPENVQGFAEAVEQGRPLPAHPQVNKVWDPLKAGLAKAFNGKDVEKAMNTAAKEIRSNWE